jgi:hypothetical protein
MGVFPKVRFLFIGITLILVAYLLGWLDFICPIKRLTGLYCPMCHSTSSIHAYFSGDFLTGFFLNPLSLYFMALLAISYFKFFLHAFDLKLVSQKTLDNYFFYLSNVRLAGILIPANLIYLNFF